MDAPLGWPRAMAPSLARHRAGDRIDATAHQMFRRYTDDAIHDRLRKRPLEVGANLIARTAVSALGFLHELRRKTGRAIPLAWAPQGPEPYRAIEVYPAATRLCHVAVDRGGGIDDLSHVLDVSAVREAVLQSEHAADAAVCALAAADFLLDRACAPDDLELAMQEGWIWAPPATATPEAHTRSRRTGTPSAR